jgi:deoxycytidylate deaminase
MILDPYYSLRKKFSIIGLTGRSASGCSRVADFLCSNNLTDDIKIEFADTSVQEVLKQKICNRFIKKNAWSPYTILKYRDILLLLLFHESFYNKNNINEGIANLFDLIDGLGTYFDGDKIIQTETPRLNATSKSGCFIEISTLINNNDYLFDFLKKFALNDKKTLINSEDFNDFYFNKFIVFTHDLITILNNENYFLRCLLLHDLATSLRSRGKIRVEHETNPNIFIVVEHLNWILKNHKNFSSQTDSRYIIDSLKNSLELTYLKEKYSAFYMISVNKSDEERLFDLKGKLDNWVKHDTAKKSILYEKLIKLDDTEYKSKEVNSGKFSSPDVENCIQKSDYHIFYSDVKAGKFDSLSLESVNESKEIDENYITLDLKLQLIRLLSLIFNPGLVTPSFEERLMQVAFTAKLSSGCISRQVGAIVTDEHYSVKAIGWNDVAENQVSCNLRDFRDLRDDKNESHFSEFERNDGAFAALNYSDNLSFKNKVVDRFSVVDDLDDKLVGKPCSFCFKSCHNAFEEKDNQVHTRSLHAEENAMLQISKYGGQALKGGFLFTTASPCELCAKKAFQLGLTKIFYIDPYPGISRFHTLKNGISKDSNPALMMYQGAIGRGYLRLYQPFMSYKDELGISTGIKF